MVKDALATGGVAIAVACNALLDVVVVDLSVEHGLDAGFETEFGVVHFTAGFDELGHAYAEDVAWCFLFWGHFGIICDVNMDALIGMLSLPEDVTLGLFWSSESHKIEWVLVSSQHARYQEESSSCILSMFGLGKIYQQPTSHTRRAVGR